VEPAAELAERLAMMLRLTNVRKAFGALVAVDGLSLELAKGEVFGLLGPNGAGKSTTIAMAVGLLPPDAGKVELDDGSSPLDASVRNRIGVAPQQIALYDELTADENLQFFGKLYGLSGKALADRVTELLTLTGLSERRRDRVKGFSGGMKRRLNLGAAILHRPPLVLLDEPTAGVDPQSRNAIFEIIRTLTADGATILYTTHYMEEAQKLCNRVGIIDHGKLLALGTVDELIGSHGGKSLVTIQEVVAGDGVEEIRERTIATLDPAGETVTLLKSANVRGLKVDRPDLETVFLALTGRSLRD
jgi:ABC-2 type transport system ATP-binding protein